MGKAAGGGREPLGEVRQLGGLLLAGFATELCRDRRDLPLQAPALGFQGERPRVARGQRVLDVVEARRVLTGRWRIEQGSNLVVDHQDGQRHLGRIRTSIRPEA